MRYGILDDGVESLPDLHFEIIGTIGASRRW